MFRRMSLLAALALAPVVAHAQAIDKLKTPLQAITLDSQETAGGHTIARHVAKSADFIKGRVIDQQLDAASTFPDKATAQTVCMAGLNAHHTEINAKAFATQAGPANVAYTYDAGHDIGQFLTESNVQDGKGRVRKDKKLKSGATSATIVVHYVWGATTAGPHKFYLLTCYPNPK
jgi:hypothetical protein